MSKRVQLNDREISHIVKGLKALQANAGANYPVVEAGRAAYQDIIDKLTAGNGTAVKDSEASND